MKDNSKRFCHECYYRGAHFDEKFCRIQCFGVCDNTRVKSCVHFKDKNSKLSEFEKEDLEEHYEKL